MLMITIWSYQSLVHFMFVDILNNQHSDINYRNEIIINLLHDKPLS